MNTTQTAKQVAVTPIQKVRELIGRQSDEIAKALPKFLTPERFIRVALTTINKTPKLLDCTETSLMACLMDCAQLGLEPDNVMGRAYLIPFNDNKTGRVICTLIVGYKGLCDLAYRSGKVKSLMAQIVCEKDEFDFQFGIEHKLNHKPYLGTEDRGQVIAAYAYAIMENGVSAFDVMGVDDIHRIRQRSKAKDSGPWVADWDEMARKTVLKRLSKYLPLSVEFMDAVARDNQDEDEERLKAAKVVLSVPAEIPVALPSGDETIPMPSKTEDREKVVVDQESSGLGALKVHAANPVNTLANLTTKDKITVPELVRTLKSCGFSSPRIVKDLHDLTDDAVADAVNRWDDYRSIILSEREGIKS